MQERPIRFYYSTHHRNLGDAANPILVETVFRCRTVLENSRRAEFFGIGSILGKVFGCRFDLGRRFFGRMLPPAVVWTSGFLRPPAASQIPVRKLDIRALRGRLSRDVLEWRLGRPLDVPLGDGGLLFDELLPERPAKTAALGIIPHYRELDHPLLAELLRRYPDAVTISPIGDPLEILRRIAGCETILSSSLHGLIAADALGIPNRHLVFGDSTRDLFKYQDYYSAFGLPDEPLDAAESLRGDAAPDLIRRQYRISADQVAEIRAKIRAAFPFLR